MTTPILSLRRLGLATPVVALLATLAIPAAASSAPAAASPSGAASASATPSPTPDPSQQAAAVAAAQQQLQQAQVIAKAQDTQLAQAQQNLASVQASVTGLQAQETKLTADIAADQLDVATVNLKLDGDRAALAAYLRSAYETGGHNSGFFYVWSASGFSDFINRSAQVDQVGVDGNTLLQHVKYDQASAQKTLDDAKTKQAQLTATRQQAQTEQLLLQDEIAQVQAADQAAQQAVVQAQSNVTAAVNNTAAAAAAGGGPGGVLYLPVPGVNFTIDTDLTQPSGETADRLNAFLQGTALQGLGQSYIDAETKYHVSARYLLAHSIEESAFGTSNIARDKHNLFGYGANDANPYNDAYSFTTFADCINFVASKVSANYLTPTGPFFHGPTLRGMNVSYATDIKWANNIARIANSFP